MLTNSKENLIKIKEITASDLYLKLINSLAINELKYFSTKDISEFKSNCLNLLSSGKFLLNTTAALSITSDSKQLVDIIAIDLPEKKEDIDFWSKSITEATSNGAYIGVPLNNNEKIHHLFESRKKLLKKLDDSGSEKATKIIVSMRMDLVEENELLALVFGSYKNIEFALCFTDEEFKKIKKNRIFMEKISNTSNSIYFSFIDEYNRFNALPNIGSIEVICGKGQALMVNEAMVTGNLDIYKFVSDGRIEWEILKEAVHLAIRMLDGMLDISDYPIKEVSEKTKNTRKIGLGIHNFWKAAQRVCILNNNKSLIDFANDLTKFINKEAKKASQEIGSQKGSFGYFKGSVYDNASDVPIRNANLMAITDVFLKNKEGFLKEISLENQMLLLSSFQKYVDNGVYMDIDFFFLNQRNKTDQILLMAHGYGIKNVALLKPDYENIISGNNQPVATNKNNNEKITETEDNNHTGVIYLNTKTAIIKTPCGEIELTIHQNQEGKLEKITAWSDEEAACLTEQLSVTTRLINTSLGSGLDPNKVVGILGERSCIPISEIKNGNYDAYSCSGALSKIIKEVIKNNKAKRKIIF